MGKEFYSKDLRENLFYYEGRIYYISSYPKKTYLVSSDELGDDVRIEGEISDHYTRCDNVYVYGTDVYISE